MRIVLTLAALLAAGAVQAQPAPAAPSALDAALAAAKTEYPGVAYVVMGPGGERRAGAFGVGAEDQPFTSESPIDLYSVAKPMTAVLAAQLAVDGDIDVDAPIGDIAPAPWNAVTLRQLLTHTAGVRHYRKGEWLKVSDRPCATTGEALTDFIADPAVGPAGAYSYSSFGYVLVSHVLAARAGGDFGALLRSRVLEPVGARAQLWAPGSRRPPNGFEAAGRGFKPARAIDNSCKFGAGGVIGSADDLARFGYGVVSHQLIPAEVLGEMLTTGTAATSHYGAGWGTGTLADGTPIAAHSGSGMGGASALVLDLTNGRAAAVTGNLDGPSLIDEAKALLLAARSPGA